MSIASVTPTAAFPQSQAGIQPVAGKAGEAPPSGQTRTDNHRAPPQAPTTSGTTAGITPVSQASASSTTTSQTATLNQLV